MVLSLKCLHCYLQSLKQQQSCGSLDLLTHSVIREILNFFHGELCFCLHSFPRARSQFISTLSECGKRAYAPFFPHMVWLLSYLPHLMSSPILCRQKAIRPFQSICFCSAGHTNVRMQHVLMKLKRRTIQTEENFLQSTPYMLYLCRVKSIDKTVSFEKNNISCLRYEL